MALRVGLAHTEVKIRRAYKHLEELKRAVSEFRKNGYTVVRQDDPGKGVHHALIQLKIAPDDLATLPGEFAYSLRSSLDHLVWQLALLTTDTPNPWTSFPIYGTAPKTKSRYWESLSDIPSTAATIINQFQPHLRGAAFKDDPLWKLNELCNIDKHQVVAVSSSVFRVKNVATTKAKHSEFNHAIKVAVPLAEKENLQIEVDVSRVIFGAPIDTFNTSSDFEIDVEGLEEIYNFVRDEVIPNFESFFV